MRTTDTREVSEHRGGCCISCSFCRAFSKASSTTRDCASVSVRHQKQSGMHRGNCGMQVFLQLRNRMYRFVCVRGLTATSLHRCTCRRKACMKKKRQGHTTDKWTCKRGKVSKHKSMRPRDRLLTTRTLKPRWIGGATWAQRVGADAGSCAGRYTSWLGM